MKKILLIGGGRHLNSCVDVIREQKKYSIIGYLDKNLKKNRRDEIKNLGNDNQLVILRKKIKHAHVTIGQIINLKIREKVFNKLKKLKFDLPIILSPFSVISKSSTIGEGTIIMHGAIINANAKIGKNCIINTGAIIEHDATIGNHCHISTGAIINGGAIIGNNSFIGSGSIIKQEIKVGSKCFINSNLFINNNLKTNQILKK
jgi:sugar O-acyltransferase (sialic acid O-acetyltransferase NeuD family)